MLSYLHIPGGWNTGLNWICQLTCGKRCRKDLLNIALAEIVYTVWTARNKIIIKTRQKNVGAIKTLAIFYNII